MDYLKLLRTLNDELAVLSDWFKANKLSLNIKTTNFVLFGNKRIPKNSADLYIIIDNESIIRVEYTKFLGVFVDQRLIWRTHMDYISCKITKSVVIMYKLKFLLPTR